MKTRFRDLAPVLWLAVAATHLLGAVDANEWPRQLPFAVARPGLVRVELPAESLALTRPDRGDVRVLGPDDHELPWRLYRAIAAEPPRIAFPARRPTARIEDRRSVFEFETGTDRGLSGLRVETTATGFFKAAVLEGQRDGHWERLVSGIPIYQNYQGATEVRLDFAPGPWTRMRLTLDDRRSPPIPLQGIELIASSATPMAIESVPASIRARIEDPGVTRFLVDLGAAGLDVAWIELETPEPVFTRPVRILSERIAGDAIVEEELVRAFVHRIPGDERTTEDNRRIRVERGVPTREIVLLVENGDSPPLASPLLRVGLHAQRIEFWATAAGTHRLLSGNAFAATPRYDIARLALPSEIAPEAVLAAEPWSANPAYRQPAVGPDSLGIGAVFSPQGWHHRRALVAGTGTFELELPADVLAAARPDLADLRIVAAGRQVPFVADRGTIRRALPVALVGEPRRAGARASVWRVEFDRPGIPVTVLRVDTTQTAFARSVRWIEVAESRGGSRWTNVLASAEWRRVPGTPARPLELVPSSPPNARATWLEIDDGDNPPLPVGTATAEFATRRLHFLTTGPGPLELLYGNPDATAPRYDLAILADRLAASAATPSTLGPAAPAATGWNDLLGSGKAVQGVFWGVLVVVVVALFAVIRRLLPAPPAS